MSTTSNTYIPTNLDTTATNEHQKPGLVQQAYEGGANLATGAADTIRNTSTVDPTTQYHNRQPHTGGVGDLGTGSNTDVVRLPEERKVDDLGLGASNYQPPEQQPGYMAQAYSGAASMATTAVNTLSSALNSATASVPPTLKNAIVPDPSTHYRNKQPHIGGVGDLGTTSEADVTRLPEERLNPDPMYTGRATVADNSLSNPAMTDPVNIQQRMNAREPPQPYPQTGSGVAKGPITGVNDLGTSGDADVARLPDERANPDPLAAKPGGNRPHERSQDNAWDRRDPDTNELHHKNTAGGHVTGVVHDVTQEGHSGGLTGSNHDVDHGLGMEHRSSTRDKNEKPFVDTSDRTTGTTSDRTTGTSGAGGYDAGARPEGPLTGAGAHSEPKSATSPTKIDKLKGKIMVAKGKLTKDEEEIAQGKRLQTTGKAVDIDEIMNE